MNMVTEIITLHKIIEEEASDPPYSQMTVNVFLKNGVPVIKTLNIVKQERIKYNDDTQ